MKSDLRRLATAVRTSLLHRWECLDAACLPASEALAKYLFDKGYKPKVIKGTYWIDNPDPEHSDEWDPGDFDSEDAFEEAKHHPIHFWVEAGRFLIDISADQFQPEVEDRIPAVVIGTYKEFPRYKKEAEEVWPPVKEGRFSA